MAVETAYDRPAENQSIRCAAVSVEVGLRGRVGSFKSAAFGIAVQRVVRNLNR
jgi:hypothetical protein